MPELFPEECDCEDEDIDILTGISWCWQCGTRRYLSSEELKMRLEIEAEHQTHYDEFCETMEKAGYVSPPLSDDDPGAPDTQDDEIPF